MRIVACVVLGAFAAAVAAPPAGLAAAQLDTDIPDLVKMMDANAPKYGTPECTAARQAAAKYDPDILGHIALGAALGFLGPVGLAIAADMDDSETARAKKALDELFRACGEDAVLPYYIAEANKGDEWAQAWLGQIYARGIDGRPDGPTAIHWYEMAAKQGNVAAEVNLGAIYAAGRLVPQDMAMAEKLWSEASENGSPEGKTNLGRLYADQKRYDEARREFAGAARLGHASAQFYLGQIYVAGLGVDKNDKLALFWFGVAAANGCEEAAAARDAVAARLEQGAVSYVNHQVNTCKVLQFKHCSY